jgi:tungstate transport system ATP-binding protein
MLFQISQVTKVYGERIVLDIPWLEIEKGRSYALLGPNGAGKTTLLNILGFLEPPTKGQIFFNSNQVEFSEIRLQTLRKKVVIVDQNPILFTTSVFKNLEFGLKIRGIPKRKRERRIAESLDMVGMRHFSESPAHRLSGGETQRVALAARLALKPDIMLLDEPTANVDAASAQLIKEASLRAHKEWGSTIVVASHDRDWVYEVCDEVLHLLNGKLSGTGKENIVSGPWKPHSNGHWGKRMTDGQWVVVPQPPEDKAIAIISPSHISTAKPVKTNNPDAHFLEGKISRLSLEKKAGDIEVTILIGNLPFIIKLTKQQVYNENLFPGCNIIIQYYSDNVTWY